MPLIKDIKYVNHRGEEIFLSSGTIRCDSGSLHDWSINYETVSGKVSISDADLVQRSIRCIIAANSPRMGLDARNRLYEVFAADLYARKMGRLYVGEWYLDGYIFESKKDRYWITDSAADYFLEFIGDAKWKCGKTIEFMPDNSALDYKYLDFPIGFPFDLSPNRALRSLENASREPCSFRLIIYGPAINPYVIIGNNKYQVNTGVGDGGILTIDSATSSCILKSIDGVEENVFNRRLKGAPNSGEYTFERIPPGILPVSWDNGFGFDLTMIEERSEPRWT